MYNGENMKIAHFGAYGINIGDNIALKNVRKGIEKALKKPAEWTSINILDFHKEKNNIAFSLKRFKEISDTHDLLVIGGGGLLEGGVYNSGFATGYKLPFNADVLSVISIPIVVFSVGVNYFRMVEGFNSTGSKEIKNLIQHSKLFSVRNDGSKESIKDLFPNLTNEVYEIPDPGLMYINEAPIRQSVDKAHTYFQPAWNGDQRVLGGRFTRTSNITEISKFVIENKLSILPHSPKDYNFLGLPPDQYFMTLKEFNERATLDKVESFTDEYSKFHAVVAMRGHGQLISIGANVPSLYLSTQDKVSNFSLKNGFTDYNIDLLEYNWAGKLHTLYERLLTDPEYIKRWYDIRAVCMERYNTQFNSYCDKVINCI